MSPWVNIAAKFHSSQGLHIINYKLAQDEGADISTTHHKQIWISNEKLNRNAYWGGTTIWKTIQIWHLKRSDIWQLLSRSSAAGKTNFCAHRVSRSKGEGYPGQENFSRRLGAPLGAFLPTLCCHLPRFLGPWEKAVPLQPSLLELGHVSTECIIPYQLTSNLQLLKTS